MFIGFEIGFPKPLDRKILRWIKLPSCLVTQFYYYAIFIYSYLIDGVSQQFRVLRLLLKLLAL